MNPFVFIVGCARSGTTLLQRVVDAHPQIAMVPELHWITNFKRGGQRLSFDGHVNAELVTQFVEHKRFGQLGLRPEDIRGLVGIDESVRCAEFLGRLFGLYAEAKRKPLVGNKTPSFGKQLLTLHALWPGAKFVHLIRDGRDVCLSVRNWKKAAQTVGRFVTWAEDPVSTIALWWTRKVQVGRENGKALGPDLYYELRYESLVADPVVECTKLCAFLGVPYDEAMVRYHEKKPGTGRHGKKQFRPITQGLRDWRSQMPAADVERFEAAAGEMIDELAYPRVFPHPRPEVIQSACRIHDQFIYKVRA